MSLYAGAMVPSAGGVPFTTRSHTSFAASWDFSGSFPSTTLTSWG